MNTRTFGRTGWRVSEIGFGGWGIGGGAWGGADDDESMAALHAALDAGIDFFDTADVYGDGRSERLIGRLRRERPDPFWVATKVGRRLAAQVAAGYTAENLTAFVDRSLINLGVERLDLVQLHCPPTEVYYRPEVFAALDDLVAAGKLAFYGVSVEKVEEALKAIEYPNVQSVQIIFNAFRLRPLVPEGATLAQCALRWILGFEAVTCVIPGARNASRVVENAGAADLPPPSPEALTAVRQVYDSLVRPLVHHRW